MQSNNKKFLDNLVSRTKIYLILIFALLCIISLQDKRWIVPCIVLFVSIILYTYFANNKIRIEIS